MVYFTIFVVMCTISCFVFIFLPTVKKGDAKRKAQADAEEANLSPNSEYTDDNEDQAKLKNQEEEDYTKVDMADIKKTPKEVVQLVLKLFKNPRMRRLMPFMCFSGMMQGIPNLALYRITTKALVGEPDVEKYKKISLTMATIGLLGVLSGQFI